MQALGAIWDGIAAVVQSAPAQVAIAVVALASFYKNFLERPRLGLLPADTFRLVLGVGDGVTAAHLMCTLVNSGASAGVLQRLEAEITPPGRTPDIFVWDEFFKYREGGDTFEKVADPHPIAVAARQSAVLFVQFRPEDRKNRFDWPAGRYHVAVKGWVNSASRKERPHFSVAFHFLVLEMEAVDFRNKFHHQPTVKAFPVVEWQRAETRDPFASGGA